MQFCTEFLNKPFFAGINPKWRHMFLFEMQLTEQILIWSACFASELNNSFWFLLSLLVFAFYGAHSILCTQAHLNITPIVVRIFYSFILPDRTWDEYIYFCKSWNCFNNFPFYALLQNTTNYIMCGLWLCGVECMNWIVSLFFFLDICFLFSFRNSRSFQGQTFVLLREIIIEKL